MLIKYKYWLQFTLSALLLLVVVSLLYPYCQYYVDTDATAYLSLTKHYARGDFYKGMSSLWNPLHAFIAGALFQQGLVGSVFDALLYTNVIAAIGTIITSIVIFNKFIATPWLQWSHAIFLSFFWGINAYFQLTSDVFGVLGLNLFLIALLNNLLLHQWKWNLLLALSIVLSCFAKTYSFYIEVLVLVLWVVKLVITKQLPFKRALLKLSFIGSISFLLLLPWVIAFHHKYDTWQVSLAGKYNMTTRILGTVFYKSDITVLEPPSNEGALSYWEDPHWLQQGYVSVWDNAHTMKRYMLRLGYNAIEWVDSMGHLSVIYGGVWLVAIALLILAFRQKVQLSLSKQLLLLFFIIFPVGLWLVHVEARYMWFTITLCLVIAYFLKDHLPNVTLPKVFRNLASLLILGSFLIGPISDLNQIIHVGKKEYDLAQALKQKNINGSFFTNLDYVSGRQSEMLRLSAYLEQPIYTIGVDTFSMKEKIVDAARYGVDYYFMFVNEVDGTTIDSDVLGQFEELTKGQIKGIRVFKLAATAQ